MRKLTSKQRKKELEAIAAIPDTQIDTSDIPGLTKEQMKRAVRAPDVVLARKDLGLE